MLIAAVLLVGLFLLYWFGWMPVSTKRAVTFIGSSGLGNNGMGASFTSCTGKIHKILRFQESRSYSFHLSGHLQQGSISVMLLDQKRQPVLQLSPDTPAGMLSAERGKRYFLYITFQHASGDYQLDWT